MTLGPGEEQELHLRAAGAGLLRGRLNAAVPLPQLVPVVLTLLDADGNPTARGRGTFAEHGVFEVPHLEDGTYEVRVEPGPFSPARLAGRARVSVRDHGEASVQLELVSE